MLSVIVAVLYNNCSNKHSCFDYYLRCIYIYV